MKRCCLLIYMLPAFALCAGDPVDYQFQPGDPIRAAEVNGNFQELADRIDNNISSLQVLDTNMTNTDASIIRRLEDLEAASLTRQTQAEYVGVSNGTTTGDAGIAGMTQLCQADYPGSRMCTSVEFANSTSFPNLPNNSAFIRPVLGSLSDGDYQNNYVFDSGSGRTLKTTQTSCGGWTVGSVGSSHGFALGINSAGGFMVLGCANANPVACCK
ncbi:hypothetical protein [Ferrimonas gelatinilytica]|uniref:Uncharacterized protein n=1 Tax=Ferrimonas gelatinilytica TaxID=1255257 RepID=A0ABP9RSN2_9GAMM